MLGYPLLHMTVFEKKNTDFYSVMYVTLTEIPFENSNCESNSCVTGSLHAANLIEFYL